MSKPFYLTTTLPYVNADPHIGFAFELVTADIIARYRKLCGDEVFFNTGTDEHGLKVYRKAQEEGKDSQAYADEYAAKYRSLTRTLGLDTELLHFIRTTEPHHKRAAQELWRRCANAGDVYKKNYRGLYCPGDEAFIKESELVGGKCPNHPTTELLEIEEENYFFSLKKYEAQLLEYLGREGVIVPEWRRQEAIQFVKRGLEDFSVSRLKEKMPWGVLVPGDDSQVMYVWFDALTNYISTLGWPEDEKNFEKFWGTVEVPNAVQLAGKDQVRFQSIMWQAMLMSAGLPTTKRIVYHGFVTSGGQKMSKSLGNVIDPVAIVDEFGVDALRYYLARHIHPFEDSDFTPERFKEAYNADLADGLGNQVARIMKLAEDHLSAPEGLDEMPRLDEAISSTIQDYNRKIEQFRLSEAMEVIAKQIGDIDRLIQKKEPFKLIKTEPEKGREEIKNLVWRVGRIATLLEPVMPVTSESIMKSIKENKKPENLFPRKE